MRWRYLAVFVFFIFAFVCVWAKLFYWQIVKADELSALEQSQSSLNLQIPPIRGDILTSDNFPIVTNKMSYLVYADPQEVQNETTTAQLLASTLTIDVASISAQLDQHDKVWVPLAANIDNTTKQRVAALNLPGIDFQETPTRYYPEASMAAQLLGFVGKDTFGNPKGYFGIEGYYDRQLRGRVGETQIIRDAFGKPVFAKLVNNSGQQDGRSLLLHIDRVIQFIAERKLEEGVQKYGAKSGSVIVMDPKTGAILALAGYPTFNPQDYWDFTDDEYKNPTVSNTYEPGSTFKPLVMSAAINEGLVTPTSTCPICGGPVKVSDYEIKTWNDQYFPNTNMIDIMIHSDNTGMVYIAQKLGLDRMLDYINKFGFGQTTGIDIQGEVAPQVKPRDSWYATDLATAGFGQGIAVTPIELIDAFASIANNGARMEPHIVDKIITPDGQTITIPPKVLDQPISEKTAKIMTEILVDTTNKGEASFARLKGYRIAGKTGTASIAKDGHYDQTNTIASFIGFAPADDPKFVMLVIMDEPSVSIYGAETAAPVFFDISQGIFDHYGISPTGD